MHLMNWRAPSAFAAFVVAAVDLAFNTGAAGIVEHPLTSEMDTIGAAVATAAGSEGAG